MSSIDSGSAGGYGAGFEPGPTSARPTIRRMGTDVVTVRAMGAIHTVRFLALSALVTVLALGALGWARMPAHSSEGQVVTGAAMAGACAP